jgi:antitoxin component YwqK of YwqJK toxin-antitoxin module
MDDYPEQGFSVKGFYEHGIKEGVWEFFHSGGKLWKTGGYLEGLKEGHWEYFHENGTLQCAGSYRKDLEVGYWEWFDERGHIDTEKTCTYQNGEIDR